MTAVTKREFWSARKLYPLMGVLLVGVLIGISRCPLTYAAAADFTLPLVSPDGRLGPDRMHLADQRGKVVVLDFWATWCGPCVRTTPELVRLSRRFRDRGLVVVGVNVDEDGWRAVPGFMRQFGVDYPMVYDETGVHERYNVHGLPTVVLIDRQGRIRHVHTGQTSEDELAREVGDLL